MVEHFKFFSNENCEYFPCHKSIKDSSFNCLFCYCPLYALKDDCGGNFKYTNSVKDCSQCTIPHSKGAYDYVMSRIQEIIRLGSERD